MRPSGAVGGAVLPVVRAPGGGHRVALEERRVVTVLFADLVGYTDARRAPRPGARQAARSSRASSGSSPTSSRSAGASTSCSATPSSPCSARRSPTRTTPSGPCGPRCGCRRRSRRSSTTGRRRRRRSRCASASTPARCSSARWPAPTTRRWATSSTPPSRLQSLAPPGGVLIGSATAALCSPGDRARAVRRSPRIRGREQVEQSWLVTGAVGGRHPARALRRAVRRAAPASGRCSTPPCSSCATATAASCRSSARPAPARPGSPTRSSSALEGEAIVVRTACAPYGETNVWAPVITGVCRRCSASIPTSPPTDVERVVEAPRRRAVGLAARRRRAATATSTRSPTCSGHPSPLDRLDAAGARDAVAGDGDRHAAPPRPDPDDRAVGRQPAVGRPDAARPARRRSCARSPTCRSCSSPRSGPTPDCVWPPPVDRPLVAAGAARPARRRRRRRRSCAAILERGDGRRAERARSSPGSSTAAAATRCSSSSWPRWRRRAASASELPGSLRALIAARLDQLPAAAAGDRRQRRRARRPRTRSARSATFAEAMGQEFRVADLDELAADGLLEIDGRWWRFRSDVVREVAYQTLTKRVRAQRHAGVAAVMAAAQARRSTTSPTTRRPPPSCSPSSGRSTACARRSPATPSPPCSRRPRRRVETGRYETADPPRQPGARPPPRRPGHRAQPAARARRGRARAAQRRRGDRPTPTRCSSRRHRRRRPHRSEAEARRRLGHDRPGAGRPRRPPGASSDAAIDALPGPGRRAAPGRRLARPRASPRCSAARWSDARTFLDEAMEIYHRDRRRARATPGPTRTWRGWRSRPATSPTPRCS